MTPIFKPRKEVLPQAQLSIWQALAHTKSLGFVLYGGTAIALRLGHRTSVDFDFFSDRPLDRIALENALPFLRKSMVLQDTPETLTVLAPVSVDDNSKVKISFFASLNMGRVGEPAHTDDGVLQVASLDDLMATKLKVILQRIEAKDYQDIAALCRAGTSLSKGLGSARAMYGAAFQPAECLKALVYFEGGDLANLAIEDKDVLIAVAREVRNVSGVKIMSSVLPV